MWIVAKWRGHISHAQHDRIGWWEQQQKSIKESHRDMANTTNQGNVWGQWLMGFAKQKHHSGGSTTNGSREWWQVEPNVGRVADGVAARVDRLKAIGNGQVPLCAATAWKVLTA